MKTKDELIALARAAAQKHALAPALVCAVVEQESRDWNPWAFNPEPKYRYFWNCWTNEPFRKVTDAEINSEVPPGDFHGLRGEDRDAEWWGQQMSFGLMQVMGAVGRECGFKGLFLTGLCDPDDNLEFGCIHLARKLTQAHGDVQHALQLWNGGGNPNYAVEVVSRLGNYQ